MNTPSTMWIILFIGMIFFIVYQLPYSHAQESTETDYPQIRVIPNVGAQYTESGQGYDVEYLLLVPLEENVIINPEEKTITFNVVGEGMPSEDMLEIRFPNEILDFPLRVFIDGVQEPKSVQSGVGEFNMMFIPLKEGSKEIKIQGITVIPEFGTVSTSILIISIISVIILTSTKRVSILSLR